MTASATFARSHSSFLFSAAADSMPGMSGDIRQFEASDIPKHGMRLDQFLVLKIPEFTRSRIQSLAKDGKISLNGEPSKSSELVRNGDQITVIVPPPEKSPDLIAEEMPLEILYEDADILVLNKPAGLAMHPGAGRSDQTLVNGLLHHCGSLSVIGGTERPGIVHRLDMETSGCVVVAKNDVAHQALSEQFASREITKTYLAVVAGQLRRPSGTVDAPIGRHRIHRQKMAVVREPDGKSAITDWRVLVHSETLSLLECRPHTGRTHQIRVHLKHIGYSIAGDPLYGKRGNFSRHMLHAWKLAFTHPRSGELMEFEAPIPADFPLRPTAS